MLGMSGVYSSFLKHARRMQRLVSVLEPLVAVTQPKVYGIERIPDERSLFVGNHTIFGFLDRPDFDP